MNLRNRLNELLLECLGHLVPDQWPGGDGFTKEDVLGEYPALAARRLVPGEDTPILTHGMSVGKAWLWHVSRFPGRFGGPPAEHPEMVQDPSRPATTDDVEVGGVI